MSRGPENPKRIEEVRSADITLASEGIVEQFPMLGISSGLTHVTHRKLPDNDVITTVVFPGWNGAQGWSGVPLLALLNEAAPKKFDTNKLRDSLSAVVTDWELLLGIKKGADVKRLRRGHEHADFGPWFEEFVRKNGRGFEWDRAITSESYVSNDFSSDLLSIMAIDPEVYGNVAIPQLEERLQELLRTGNDIKISWEERAIAIALAELQGGKLFRSSQSLEQKRKDAQDAYLDTYAIRSFTETVLPNPSLWAEFSVLYLKGKGHAVIDVSSHKVYPSKYKNTIESLEAAFSSDAVTITRQRKVRRRWLPGSKNETEQVTVQIGTVPLREGEYTVSLKNSPLQKDMTGIVAGIGWRQKPEGTRIPLTPDEEKTYLPGVDTGLGELIAFRVLEEVVQLPKKRNYKAPPEGASAEEISRFYEKNHGQDIGPAQVFVMYDYERSKDENRLRYYNLSKVCQAAAKV